MAILPSILIGRRGHAGGRVKEGETSRLSSSEKVAHPASERGETFTAPKQPLIKTRTTLVLTSSDFVSPYLSFPPRSFRLSNLLEEPLRQPDRIRQVAQEEFLKGKTR